MKENRDGFRLCKELECMDLYKGNDDEYSDEALDLMDSLNNVELAEMLISCGLFYSITGFVTEYAADRLLAMDDNNRQLRAELAVFLEQIADASMTLEDVFTLGDVLPDVKITKSFKV